MNDAKRPGELIKTLGPFKYYKAEPAVNIVLSEQNIEIPDATIVITDLIFTLHSATIKGFNPLPDSFVVYLQIDKIDDPRYPETIIEKQAILRIDSGDFEVSFPLSAYYAGWIPFYKVQAYAGAPHSEEPWKATKKLNIVLEETAKRYYLHSEHHVITEYEKEYFVMHPRIYSESNDFATVRAIAQAKRLIRNANIFLKAKDPVHQWFLLRRKLNGPLCPVHGERGSFFNTAKIDNPFCSYCYGTGIYGAFDTITRIPALVTYGVVLDAAGNETRQGTIITTAQVKPGDYVTNLREIFYVTNYVEVRIQFNVPIWYHGQLIDISPEAPIVRAIPLIIEQLELGKFEGEIEKAISYNDEEFPF